jgi:hypothetical protein
MIKVQFSQAKVQENEGGWLFQGRNEKGQRDWIL